MFKPILVQAPVNKPVSLAEGKEQCCVDDSEHDDLINRLIDAATSYIDGYSGILGRCLISQTWKVQFGDWLKVFRLPFPDVQSVTVKYLDEDGSEQTVSSSDIELVQEHGGSAVYMLDSFSKPSLKDDAIARVWVEFVAGYGDNASDIPQDLRNAVLLLVGHWHESREAVLIGITSQEVQLAFDRIMQKYRMVGI